jgi:hypothetical protein
MAMGALRPVSAAEPWSSFYRTFFGLSTNLNRKGKPVTSYGHPSTLNLSFLSRLSICCFLLLLSLASCLYPGTRLIFRPSCLPSTTHTYICLVLPCLQVPKAALFRAQCSYTFLLLIRSASQREPVRADTLAFKFPPTPYSANAFHTRFANDETVTVLRETKI